MTAWASKEQIHIGTGKTDNRPQVIKQSIADIVERFGNPETRAEKNGPYINLCKLNSDGRRAEENVEEAYAYVLDFDKGNINERIIRDKLNGYNYAAHTTYSHLLDKGEEKGGSCERWRVAIFFSEPVTSVGHFKAIDAYFRQVFKEVEIDGRCKTWSQLWFLPATPEATKSLFKSFSVTDKELFNPSSVLVAAAPPPALAAGARSPAQGGPVKEDRNSWMFKEACRVRDFGVGEASALVECSELNTLQCTPPLSDREVSKTVKSAYNRAPSKGSGEAPAEFTFDYITADKLAKKDFPKMRWLVEDLIPEGLCILGARPKKGKTRFCVGLAVDIATGNKALGRFPVRQGKVLFLSLDEGAERLFKDRLETMGLLASENLIIVTNRSSVPKLGDNFDGYLAEWFRREPNIVAVIIDTYHKIKPRTPRGVQDYEHDGECTEEIQRLAHKYRRSILVVHHTKKESCEDWLDNLLGSTGIAGGVDSALHLAGKRSTTAGVLNVTGREVRETEHTLKIDPRTGTWSYAMEGARANISEEVQAVWDLLYLSADGLTAVQIAEKLGKNLGSMRVHLSRMVDRSQLRTKKKGRSLAYHIFYQG